MLVSLMWKSLKVSPAELRLEFTLPTGQTFRWRKRPGDSYIGVIRDRVFHLKQTDDGVQYRRLNRLTACDGDDRNLLREYFNLDCCSIQELSQKWSKEDDRFGKVAPYIQGARVLRQDPLECLFEFLCSSNNNITRIQGMVESLCRTYGTLLTLPEANSTEQELQELESCSEENQDLNLGEKFYSFPTLHQLSAVEENVLRKNGFGYRAKFIEDCVRVLSEKENGGEAWLNSLRSCSYEDASEQLCKLPGVGPKVAACICLFSLDKHDVIPVDTHVHQLAMKYYQFDLEGKSLTKKVMKAIESRFREVFGEYAGWAHNVLFVSELASHQSYLPQEYRITQRKRKRSTNHQKKRPQRRPASLNRSPPAEPIQTPDDHV